MHGIVAYTFFNVYESSSLNMKEFTKRDAHKRKLVPFICLTVVENACFLIYPAA